MVGAVCLLERALAAKWLRRLLGLILFAVSFAFLTSTLIRLDPLGRMALFNSAAHLELVLLAIGYGGSLMLLAQAWAAIADPERRLSQPDLVTIYGRSTLAKYVPGVVLQYGTRQWLGTQAGLRHGALARASFVEIALHVVFATAIALITGAACGLVSKLLGISTGIALLGLSALIHCCGQRALFAAASLQACFFVFFWLLSLLTAWVLVGDAKLAATLATIFLAGWLAGFVLPFVPGGIGVREATIVAIGTGHADLATLLTFAALTRLVTLGGDLTAGMASYLLPTLSARLNRQASTKQ